VFLGTLAAGGVEDYRELLDVPGLQAIPAAKGAQRRVVELKNDQQTAHVAEFLTAVLTRQAPACNACRILLHSPVWGRRSPPRRGS